jgi:transcription elongation factor Elf1
MQLYDTPFDMHACCWKCVDRHARYAFTSLQCTQLYVVDCSISQEIETLQVVCSKCFI